MGFMQRTRCTEPHLQSMAILLLGLTVKYYN
jgi:hypothetical protein